MIPNGLELLRSKVSNAIQPIRQVDNNSSAPEDLLFTAQRTRAGRELSQYYLIYFLFVDLLKFRNLGKFEKIAWSVPIDFNGKAFLIDYRKFGVGVFVEDPDLYEVQ